MVPLFMCGGLARLQDAAVSMTGQQNDNIAIRYLFQTRLPRRVRRSRMGTFHHNRHMPQCLDDLLRLRAELLIATDNRRDENPHVLTSRNVRTVRQPSTRIPECSGTVISAVRFLSPGPLRWPPAATVSASRCLRIKRPAVRRFLSIWIPFRERSGIARATNWARTLAIWSCSRCSQTGAASRGDSHAPLSYASARHSRPRSIVSLIATLRPDFSASLSRSSTAFCQVSRRRDTCRRSAVSPYT